MALWGAAKLIRFYRHDVHAVRIVWVHQHRETKIRGHPTRDVLPRITPVIGAVQPPVVLQEQSLGPRFMERNLMHALSELWIFLWQEPHTYSIVARLPRGPPILGAVNTSDRHSHVHAVFVARVRQ